ncbi:MAG: transketolase [Deltaproteobacteria bacterium]|nr:transketolase [Deltaproteobacteria bacterium]
MPCDRARHDLTASTLRCLAIDAIQQAGSGHPGLPLGLADVATVLWSRFLKHDPADPAWPDRDRFVLSGGHGSTLLYGLLHLSGYDLALDQIKRFRQLGSLTPGHPEHGLTPGVETTTGPLGQGLANAVGMALAERWLSHRYNRPGHTVVDHRTWVCAGDGDLMEGVSHEACALAGHWGLAKLTLFFDDNGITIDGPTHLANCEDVLARFVAYGWHAQRVDGHDPEQIEAAIQAALDETARPSLIACRTHIGFGSPNRQDTAKAHGEPLGEDEVRLTKARLGWPSDEKFRVPAEARDLLRARASAGAGQRREWQRTCAAHAEAHPALWRELEGALRGELPAGWDADLPQFAAGEALATRAASGAVISALSAHVPTFIGGSADLTPSNNTRPRNEPALTRQDPSGRYIHFGIREHGMAGVLNGMALHGGLRVYGGTFLVFSDYCRPSLRLAAMMELPVVYVFTHDSIGLGEDGPTHQPIEQVAALRAIPQLWLMRPADANETVEAWRSALSRRGPTALCLTRQKVPTIDRKKYAPASGAARGGYVISDIGDPQALLIATGSEVAVALEAQQWLARKNVRARVVSLPCWELFAAQPDGYREQVLPPEIRARVAVEAGVALGWERWVGSAGEVVGLERFGASAPAPELFGHFGLTAEAVGEAALRTLKRISGGG